MFYLFSMFSIFSKLSPCSPIQDYRTPQFVEPFSYISHSWHNLSSISLFWDCLSGKFQSWGQKTLDNGGRATQRGHIRPPNTRHNWVNSSWRRPVVAKLPSPTTSSHDLVGDQVENLCNLYVFVTIWLPLTCRRVLKYLCMPDPDLRSSLRMRTNVDDVWTSGPCRTLLLILCSAKIALVQANGGAILPSLNKVNWWYLNILRDC